MICKRQLYIYQSEIATSSDLQTIAVALKNPQPKCKHHLWTIPINIENWNFHLTSATLVAFLFDVVLHICAAQLNFIFTTRSNSAWAMSCRALCLAIRSSHTRIKICWSPWEILHNHLLSWTFTLIKSPRKICWFVISVRRGIRWRSRNEIESCFSKKKESFSRR